MTTIVSLIAALFVGMAIGAWLRSRREYPGNLYRYDMAKSIYGEGAAIRQLVECDNSHLPGDCPLCGAK